MKRVLLVDKNKFRLAYLYLSRNSNTIPKTTQKVTSNDLINGLPLSRISYFTEVFMMLSLVLKVFFNQKAAIPWYKVKVKVNFKRE